MSQPAKLEAKLDPCQRGTGQQVLESQVCQKGFLQLQWAAEWAAGSSVDVTLL
jgi:hypothetical protein